MKDLVAMVWRDTMKPTSDLSRWSPLKREDPERPSIPHTNSSLRCSKCYILERSSGSEIHSPDTGSTKASLTWTWTRKRRRRDAGHVWSTIELVSSVRRSRERPSPFLVVLRRYWQIKLCIRDRFYAVLFSWCPIIQCNSVWTEFCPCVLVY